MASTRNPAWTFQEVKRVEGGGGAGGVRRKNLPHPASPDGIGEFLAMHAKTGRVLWRHRTRVTTIPGELLPEKKSPPVGNAMFVFALPENISARTTTSNGKR